MSMFFKRVEALALISGATLGTAATASAPTPVLEAPKQLGIVAADAGLCYGLAKIYFGKDFSEGDLEDTFRELTTTVGVGLLAGYGITKLIEAMLAEGLNLVPVAGWALSGVITGTVTGLVGLWFWAGCERAHRSGDSLAMELALLLTVPEASPEARAQAGAD